MLVSRTINGSQAVKGVLGGFCGVDAFEFQERDVGIGVALSALEGNVLRPYV